MNLALHRWGQHAIEASFLKGRFHKKCSDIAGMLLALVLVSIHSISIASDVLPRSSKAGVDKNPNCQFSVSESAKTKSIRLRSVLAKSKGIPKQVNLDELASELELTIDAHGGLCEARGYGTEFKLEFESFMVHQNGRKNQYWTVRKLKSEHNKSYVYGVDVVEINKRHPRSLFSLNHGGDSVQTYFEQGQTDPMFVVDNSYTCHIYARGADAKYQKEGSVELSDGPVLSPGNPSDCIRRWQEFRAGKIACESKGGAWHLMKGFMSSRYGCTPPRAKDAGRLCTGGSECQYGCADVGKSSDALGVTFGECRAWISSDCGSSIDGGKRVINPCP